MVCWMSKSFKVTICRGYVALMCVDDCNGKMDVLKVVIVCFKVLFQDLAVGIDKYKQNTTYLGY